MSRWDAGAPAVPPPANPEQRRVVEKLAEYRARNGEAFVAVVRSKQSGNPLYAFLDGPPNDPIAKYYQQCLHSHAPKPAEVPPPPSLARASGPGAGPDSTPSISTPSIAKTSPNAHLLDFPAGLIPSLARAANAAASDRNHRYASIHPDDVPSALARAEATAEASGRGSVSDDVSDRDSESARAYLADRLTRFAQDLADGGRARARRRDRERAESEASVRARRRADLDRIKRGGVLVGNAPGVGEPGGVLRTWPSRGGGRRGDALGKMNGDAEFARRGFERRGLGVARVEEEQEKATQEDAYAAYRKKRSGTYHALISAERGK